MASRGLLSRRTGRIKRQGRLADQSVTGQHQPAWVASPDEQQHGRSVPESQHRVGDSGQAGGRGQKGKYGREETFKHASVFELAHLLVRSVVAWNIPADKGPN